MMLNISLSTSQPFEFPQVRILCLDLHYIFNKTGSLESNFLSSLYILDISHLSDVGLIKTQSGGCHFVLLTSVLTEVLQFYEISFVNLRA